MVFGIFIIVLLLLVVIYLSLDKITETINKCIVKINNIIEENNKRKEEKKKSDIKSLEKSKQQEQSNSTTKNVVEYGDIDDEWLGHKIVTDFDDILYTEFYDDIHIQKRRRDEINERWSSRLYKVDF